jgi:hypothetical protein
MLVLTTEDAQLIRAALQQWGKSQEVIEAFFELGIGFYLKEWANFVYTDWAPYDISEYNHDIGVRYWIQLAIEHSTPETRAILEEAVTPLDECFRARAKPCRPKRYASPGSFSGHPYFWETSTIHPEMEAL